MQEQDERIFMRDDAGARGGADFFELDVSAADRSGMGIRMSRRNDNAVLSGDEFAFGDGEF